MQYTHHYDSPLGGITMASDGKALTGLWFDGQNIMPLHLTGNMKTDLCLFLSRQTDGWTSISVEKHLILHRLSL